MNSRIKFIKELDALCDKYDLGDNSPSWYSNADDADKLKNKFIKKWAPQVKAAYVKSGSVGDENF